MSITSNQTFRSFLVAILFFVLPPTLSSCGYTLLGEEYRVALLNPYLIGDEYEAFFYSTAYLPDAPLHGKTGRDRQRNCEAWATELGPQVRWSQVMDVLYGTTYDDWLKAADDPKAHPWSTNPAWRAVHARPALLEYLLWAKGYEVPIAADRQAYSWDNITSGWRQYADPIPVDEDNFRDRAESGFSAAPEGSFLQRRYAYQLLLLARYADDRTSFYRYFDDYFRAETDVLADWARHHEIHFLTDPENRYLACARSFTRCPEKALSAYQASRYETDIPNRLGLSRADRADVVAFEALRQSGYAIEALRELYRLRPDHPVFPLLLVREINKLEDWLLTEALTQQESYAPSQRFAYDYEQHAWGRYEQLRDSFYRENLVRDRAYAVDLRGFLDEIVAPAGNSSLGTAQLRLFRAQLAMLNDDPVAALNYLKGFDAIDPVGLSATQATIIRYLAIVQSADLDDANVQHQLVEMLCDLETYLPVDRQPRNALPALQRRTAQEYAARGDTAMAYFFFQRSLDLPYPGSWASDYYSRIDFLDRDLSPRLFDSIIDKVENPDRRDPVMDYLLAGHLPSVSALRDVAGTVALRRGDLAEAHHRFSGIPKDWYQRSYAFPDFLDRLPFSDWLLSGNDGSEGEVYHKADITTRLLELESNVTGPTAPAALFELGRAWYNMSAFGEAWMMLAYGNSETTPDAADAWPGDGYTFFPHGPAEFDLRYRSDRAEAYLVNARKLASDPELRAKIEFYLADLGYRRDWLAAQSNLLRYDERERRWESLHQDHWKRLEAYKKSHGTTAFYRELRAQCSWVK